MYPLEILLPGAVMGIVLGFAIQRFGAAAPPGVQKEGPDLAARARRIGN